MKYLLISLLSILLSCSFHEEIIKINEEPSLYLLKPGSDLYKFSGETNSFGEWIIDKKSLNIYDTILSNQIIKQQIGKYLASYFIVDYKNVFYVTKNSNIVKIGSKTNEKDISKEIDSILITKFEPIELNNFISLGIGLGSVDKVDQDYNLFYKYIGLGFTNRPSKVPSLKRNCDLCFKSRGELPYNNEEIKKYDDGIYNINILFKIPILNKIILSPSIGYYLSYSSDIKIYSDNIYPTEYERMSDEINEKGFCYGLGMHYVTDIGFTFGLNYRTIFGTFLNIGFIY